MVVSVSVAVAGAGVVVVVVVAGAVDAGAASDTGFFSVVDGDVDVDGADFFLSVPFESVKLSFCFLLGKHIQLRCDGESGLLIPQHPSIF